MFRFVCKKGFLSCWFCVINFYPITKRLKIWPKTPYETSIWKLNSFFFFQKNVSKIRCLHLFWRLRYELNSNRMKLRDFWKYWPILYFDNSWTKKCWSKLVLKNWNWGWWINNKNYAFLMQVNVTFISWCRDWLDQSLQWSKAIFWPSFSNFKGLI